MAAVIGSSQFLGETSLIAVEVPRFICRIGGSVSKVVMFADRGPVVRIALSLPTATPLPYNDATQCNLRIYKSCDRGSIAALCRQDSAAIMESSVLQIRYAPRNFKMSATPTIVGLGEILLDVFLDGPRFGGAPANFACSAAGVGGHAVQVAMVSAVGNDELGGQAVQSLKDHAVDVQCVDQINFPTGQDLVSLDKHGQAAYEFASNAAWDHLVWHVDCRSLLNELTQFASALWVSAPRILQRQFSSSC